MSDPIDAIVSRLTAIYGDPKTSDPEQFIKEFCGALTGFRINDIHKAIDEGRKVWKFFPRASEVIEIFREQNPPPPHQPPAYEKWRKQTLTPEQEENRKRLMETFLASMKNNGQLKDVPQGKPSFPRRTEFQQMQAQSRNDHLHRAPSGKMAAAGDTNP